MLVQNSERFAEVAEFDPSTGELRPMDRPADLSPSDTTGWYAELAGSRLVLYRSNGDLHLRVDSQVFDVDGGATVAWRRDGDEAVFTATDPDDQIELRYVPGPHTGPPLSEDPTPFVEDEDWDFGLFVHNLLADDGRRDRVLRG